MSNRTKTQEMLNLACAMWDDPLVLCYQDTEPLPTDKPSIFLAGPTSRENVLEFKWRAVAVKYLREMGFKGYIVIPEARENDFSFKEHFEGTIVAWEAERILKADLVLFWVPRHQTQLPGRVTNTELGFLSGMVYADPARFKNKFLWGYPPDAWKVKSETHWVQNIAGVRPVFDLSDLCEKAVRFFY